MDLTRTDVEILRLLQGNARLSFRELAKKIGVGVPTISAHVANLEQLEIIRGYRADIDPDRLHETSVLLLVKCAPSETPRVGEALAAFEEIRWVTRGRDPRVLALATVADEGSIGALLGQVAEVPGILDYEHFVIQSTVKDEPRARIEDGLSASLICFQCKGPIHGEPIKVKMDGRDHFLCCQSCEKLYVERYHKIKAKA